MPTDLDAFLDKTYGFPEAEWLAARSWLTKRLGAVAATGNTTSYGVLCDEMARSSLPRLDPHGTTFAALLGQINVLEHDAGRPLISAVVVSKEAGEPGVGFWNIARDLGVAFGDSAEEREAFWLESLKACFDYYGGKAR
jgi:hypothetical protein